jgi:predicted 3-demethylubiquinone-9 3-methyltransferase (glyoxalase superfamily)
MKNSPEILNELMAISPLLAGLEKVNVFTVPEGYFNELEFRITNYAILNNTSPAENINKRNLQEVPSGYFDTLSDSILAKVKAIYPENAEEELRNLSPLLFSLKGKNVFTVPANYFDKFSDSVLTNMKSVYSENAEEELRNLSPMLYSLKGENVFSVPAGYFDKFSDSVLTNMKSVYSENAEEELRNLSSMLYSLKGENVFSIPAGYFDKFSESVLANMKLVYSESVEEELRNLSPMLYSLKGENVLTVPAGYFESLAENVSEKLKPVPAKVVTMKRRTSWLKYAAAAVVTGIITITSLQLFKGSSHNSKSSLPAYIQASFKYKSEADVNAGIAKLDDADIAKYLEKNGNVLDNELLINNTDESGLPSSTDYLNDENTLNEYLDKIDADNVSKSTP